MSNEQQFDYTKEPPSIKNCLLDASDLCKFQEHWIGPNKLSLRDYKLCESYFKLETPNNSEYIQRNVPTSVKDEKGLFWIILHCLKRHPSLWSDYYEDRRDMETT